MRTETAIPLLALLVVFFIRDASGFVTSRGQTKSWYERRLNQHDQVETEESSCACPFSKAFKRYRIDLTSAKKKDSFSIPFVSNLFIKSKLENEFGSNLQWFDSQDGVQALATLWRCAASLEDSKEVVLAFPDCALSVLQRWIDIFEWSQTESALTVPRMEATLLEDASAVKLTRVEPSPQSSSNTINIDPAVITKRTQAWVKRILVEMGICPFTKSVTKSGQGLGDLGVPVARIAYHSSSASTNQVYTLMADTWEAIQNMLEAGPSGKNGVSSILLAAPGFDEDFDLWAGPIFAMLEAGVVAASAEPDVGVVCFHPKYATPDGSSWPGFGHMHSVPRLQQWLDENDASHNLSTEEIAAGGAWQRRTPHATINVLRANQLEIAEQRRTTGNLYTDNINKLVGKPDGVGSPQLQKDLEREQHLL